MKCIFCNTPLAAIDYCPGCGADVTIQKRIVRISNLLYNEGLEKARVRDMKGAITSLKRSLKFNKANTDARNLLGLCYYETGEAVSALCEWVVSKNLQQEKNLADYYLDQLQNNKNRLDTINQTIRKYNQSVMYCREDNEDMAIIQLKKVISQNPKLVKAYQLLALLYMKRQEYERARKLLKKAAHIDMTNTTTLRYLQEIEAATGKGTSLDRKHKRYEKDGDEKVSGTLRYMSGTEMVIQPTTFRDSSTIATFINIILGILLGGAIVWFLVVPASRQEVNDKANKTVTEANSKLATVMVQLEELQGEIDDYVEQAEAAEQERDDALAKAESYEDLMAAAKAYISGDESSASDLLSGLDEEDFDGNAAALYKAINSTMQSSMFSGYYEAGTTAYVQNDYQTAARQLQLAVDADAERTNSNYQDALYYLGFAYYYLGDTANANKTFNLLIQYYPGSDYANTAQGYLTSSGGDSSPADNAADLSGLGDAATGEDAGTSGSSQDIDILNDDSVTYNSNDVAWTDPTTGYQYDMYGNLLSTGG